MNKEEEDRVIVLELCQLLCCVDSIDFGAARYIDIACEQAQLCVYTNTEIEVIII